MEYDLSGIRAALVSIILCILAAAFGFPYLFPITLVIAVYAFWTGTKKPSRGKYWKAIGWIAAITTAALIIDILLLHPSEFLEPTQTPVIID